MPEVVLRHPDLPGQPIVIDVGVDEYVPDTFRLSGWEIEAEADAADARAEMAQTVADNSRNADTEDKAFRPQFAPAEDVEVLAAVDEQPAVPTPDQTSGEQPAVEPTITKE